MFSFIESCRHSDFSLTFAHNKLCTYHRTAVGCWDRGKEDPRADSPNYSAGQVDVDLFVCSNKVIFGSIHSNWIVLEYTPPLTLGIYWWQCQWPKTESFTNLRISCYRGWCVKQQGVQHSWYSDLVPFLPISCSEWGWDELVLSVLLACSYHIYWVMDQPMNVS